MYEVPLVTDNDTVIGIDTGLKTILTWSEQTPLKVRDLKDAFNEMAPDQVFPPPATMKGILMGTPSGTIDRAEYLDDMKKVPVRIYHLFSHSLI